MGILHYVDNLGRMLGRVNLFVNESFDLDRLENTELYLETNKSEINLVDDHFNWTAAGSGFFRYQICWLAIALSLFSLLFEYNLLWCERRWIGDCIEKDMMQCAEVGGEVPMAFVTQGLKC